MKTALIVIFIIAFLWMCKSYIEHDKYMRENYRDVKVIDRHDNSAYKLTQWGGDVYRVVVCGTWTVKPDKPLCDEPTDIVVGTKINDIYLNTAKELVIVLPDDAEYKIGYWFRNVDFIMHKSDDQPIIELILQ